jgi:hypothetical protein
VVSVPNVAYYRTLREVWLRGRWPLEDAGPFDRTHLRWFTRSDARRLLEQAGLDVQEVSPQFFFRGAALRLVLLLARTPLERILVGQYVLRGVKP